MQLLKIRYLQARRDLGIWALLIAAALGVFAYGFTEPGSKNNPGLVAALVLAFFVFHQNRRDIQFISTYFGRSAWQMCLGYTLSILPVTVALLLHSLWPWVLALHLSLVLLAFYKPASSRPPLLLFLTRLVPAFHFEWKSGLRQNFVLLLPLVLVAFLLSPVKLFPLLAVFMINLIASGFYTQHEPLLLLNTTHLSPNDFLKNKAWFAAKVLSGFNLPVLLINSAFQPEMLWFNLFYFFALMLLAAASVYIKYAGYVPNQSVVFSADGLVLTAGALVPYLLPLSIYVFFSARKKALNTLQHYLT